MKILVACEESGVVTAAFRSRGHLAFSCDLMPTSGQHPEWHITGDCLPLLYGEHWDMLIGFPPCTYLSKVGAPLLNSHRLELGKQAADFFYKLYNAPVDKICLENPTPLKCFNLPPYSQVIQPYWFGADYKKRTCLWLKGLPPLFATCLYYAPVPFARSSLQRYSGKARQIMRSKTFPGIAAAMAQQWG